MTCARIVTGVDKLLDLVEERNEITLTDAANALQVEKSVVSTWAHTLADGDLISVEDNLREKVLTSKHWNGAQSPKNMFARLRHMVVQKPCFSEHELRRKNNELRIREERHEQCIRTVRAKLRQLKEDELRISKAKKELGNLERKEKFIREAQRKFIQEQNQFQRIKEAFLSHEADVLHKEKMLKTLERDLALQEQNLAKQRMQIQQEKDQLVHRENNLHNVVREVQRILL